MMSTTDRAGDSARRGFVSTAGLGVALLWVGACTTEQLPVGAELAISPESITINIEEQLDANGNCRVDPGRYVDKAVVLAVTDGDGSPIGDVEVKVYTDYSGNTFPFFPVLDLFDDRAGNNNGVIDVETELVSGADDDIARVRTDRFGGDRVLLLRVNVSCSYAGEVFAFVDGATSSMRVEINAEPREEEGRPDEMQGRDEAAEWRSPFAVEEES